MKKGQKIKIEITDMSSDGSGIGRYDGAVIFVDGAVSGDEVIAEISALKKNYAIAELTEIVAESKLRAEGYCKYLDECGGCPLGALRYDEQLRIKERWVRDKLERLGGLEKPKINPIIGMEEPVRYRNKAVFAVSGDGKVGYLKKKSREVVQVDDCMLQSEETMGVARAFSYYLGRFDRNQAADKLMVRTAEGTGGMLAKIFLLPPEEKKDSRNRNCYKGRRDRSKDNKRKSKLSKGAADKGEMKRELLELEELVDMLYSGSGEKLESVWVDDRAVAGRRVILDEESGLKFEISPDSFYQVNSEQTKKLYAKAMEYADIKGGETVLDLYCGVGTIGLYAASRMNNTGLVIGIETVKSAVLDANRNSVINGIVNTRYILGKAEDELPAIMGIKPKMGYNEVNEWVIKEPELRISHADIVFLDPPRAGCEEELLSAVSEAEPDRIVYVSCDPATLARDIKYLAGRGYEFIEATPVDMFPNTASVESIVLLSHKSPDSHIDVKVEFGEGEEKVPLDKIAERAKQYQPAPRVTYKMIQEYIEEKYGFKVHTAYIAEVKRNLGLPMYDAPNMVEELKQPRRHPTAEKVEAIKDALKHFGVI